MLVEGLTAGLLLVIAWATPEVLAQFGGEVVCEPGGAVGSVAPTPGGSITGTCVSVPGLGSGTPAGSYSRFGCPGDTVGWAAAGQGGEKCCYKNNPNGTGPQWVTLTCPVGQIVTRVRLEDLKTGCRTPGFSIRCAPPPAGWSLGTGGIPVAKGLKLQNNGEWPNDSTISQLIQTSIRPPGNQTLWWCTSSSSCTSGPECPNGKTCYPNQGACQSNAPANCATLPPSSCTITGPGQVQVGERFQVRWSNSPGVTSLRSGGWFGPIDCDFLPGCRAPLISGGPLPPCPPESSACAWGWRLGPEDDLFMSAPGDAGVTITACVGAACSSCSHQVTAGQCGPDLQPAIDEFQAALDAVGRFDPELIEPVAVSIDSPVYTWHDNRGWHHVQVAITDEDGKLPAFKIPRLKSSSGIFQNCTRVKHSRQEVIVTVTRYDEDNLISRGWAMRFRTNAASADVTQPSNARTALPFGIRSVSKARHGYKPNSVWLVRDKVTR